jgi:hypothetical protein
LVLLVVLSLLVLLDRLVLLIRLALLGPTGQLDRLVLLIALARLGLLGLLGRLDRLALLAALELLARLGPPQGQAGPWALLAQLDQRDLDLTHTWNGLVLGGPSRPPVNHSRTMLLAALQRVGVARPSSKSLSSSDRGL